MVIKTKGTVHETRGYDDEGNAVVVLGVEVVLTEKAYVDLVSEISDHKVLVSLGGKE